MDLLLFFPFFFLTIISSSSICCPFLKNFTWKTNTFLELFSVLYSNRWYFGSFSSSFTWLSLFFFFQIILSVLILFFHPWIHVLFLCHIEYITEGKSFSFCLNISSPNPFNIYEHDSQMVHRWTFMPNPHLLCTFFSSLSSFSYYFPTIFTSPFIKKGAFRRALWSFLWCPMNTFIFDAKGKKWHRGRISNLEKKLFH